MVTKVLAMKLDDEDEDDGRSDLEDGINRLLDLVERPVGTLEFMLPATPESRRVIRELYDLVNRNL